MIVKIKLKNRFFQFQLISRFCPSVFIYLSSVVPAIWLLELDKIERRLRFQEETGNLNLTAIDLKKLDKLLGVQIKLPDIQVDPSTWITLIEQFLMLVLIVGRWMLPKGDLTRDQLSQLLLVYIGSYVKTFYNIYFDCLTICRYCRWYNRIFWFIQRQYHCQWTVAGIFDAGYMVMEPTPIYNCFISDTIQETKRWRSIFQRSRTWVIIGEIDIDAKRLTFGRHIEFSEVEVNKFFIY